MKKIILIFTALAFTCLSSECFAQKVISFNGYVVIDNTALPVKVLKTSSELSDQKDNNGQMKFHYEANAINQKVSSRFAVSKTVNNSAIFWTEASNYCINLNENGKGWRMPTQRELMIMYQMKAELEATSTFPLFIANRHWASTTNVSNPGVNYLVNFLDGLIELTNRVDYSWNKPCYIRCIKDLMP